MREQSPNEYYDVLKILYDYYRKLVSNLVEEIREHESDFTYPMLGLAEPILEKYNWPLYHYQTAYNAIYAEGEALFREKSIYLREDEFLCFSCRAIMHKADNSCPKCGWSFAERLGQQLSHHGPIMTEQANLAIARAREQARKWRQKKAEPEHLLFVLCQLEAGPAARTFVDAGITHSILEERIGKPARPLSEKLTKSLAPLSSTMEQLLEEARAECAQMGHPNVGTGHLLLALTQVIGSQADRISSLIQMDLRELRRLVLAQLAHDPFE